VNKCAAAYPTGGLTESGAERHHPCQNEADVLRVCRVQGQMVVVIGLCSPHRELWDDLSQGSAELHVVLDIGDQ